MVKSFIARDLYEVKTKARPEPMYVAADGMREVLDIVSMTNRDMTILKITKIESQVYIQDWKAGTRLGEAE